MNQENFDYLKEQVKYTGFGDALTADLKQHLELGNKEFQLHHSHEFGMNKTEAVLHFRKSDQSDMYFFNKYDLELKTGQSPEPLKQTFYIDKVNNYTLKEGYNLLSGRAVNKDLTNKEGEVYNAWVQMNFKETETSGNFKLKQYHQNYGYDLKAALAQLPIKELQDETARPRLLESLEKGNRQSVTFSVDGQEQNRFIEANPQFKSVTVYDSNMKRMSQKESHGVRQSEGQVRGERQSENRQHQQKASKDEDGPVNNPKRKGQSIG